MRVVVTGGTGFLGTPLVETLAERGDDVVVLTRGAAATRGRVRLVPWTATSEGPWLEEIDRADAVVHLAGSGLLDERWSKARIDDVRASRIDSARLIAQRIATGKTAVKVFVSSSGVGYYGTARGDSICTEDTPPGTDLVARICVDWEDAALRARDATRVVCLRMGVILGSDGGALAKLAGPFRAFVGGPVGSGNQYFPWIHVCDTVRAITFALDEAAIQGPINVAAPEPVTMNAFAKALGRALHRPSLFRVPAIAMKVILGGRAEVLLTGQRVVPTKLNEAGFAFVYPELQGALAHLFAKPGENQGSSPNVAGN